jgi:hypothetical protein
MAQAIKLYERSTRLKKCDHGVSLLSNLEHCITCDGCGQVHGTSVGHATIMIYALIVGNEPPVDARNISSSHFWSRNGLLVSWMETMNSLC